MRLLTSLGKGVIAPRASFEEPTRASDNHESIQATDHDVYFTRTVWTLHVTFSSREGGGAKMTISDAAVAERMAVFHRICAKSADSANSLRQSDEEILQKTDS